MPRGGLKISRLESEQPCESRYSCDWQLQYGDIRGNFSMQETVPDEKWKNGTAAPPVSTASHSNKRKRGGPNGAASEEGTVTANGGSDSGTISNGGIGQDEEKESSKWKLRYEHMAKMVQQRDQELATLRSMIVDALKDSRNPPQPSPLRLPVDV